jgi:phage baseplate assembly protein W
MRTVPYIRKRNVARPVGSSTKGWKTLEGVGRYETAVKHLCTTKRGAYLHTPDYGLRLDLYRTQSVNETRRDEIISEIVEGFARWIPDIRLVGLDVEARPGTQELKIHIKWGVPDALVYSTIAPKKPFVYGPITTLVTV